MTVDVKNGPGGRGSNAVEICTPLPNATRKTCARHADESRLRARNPDSIPSPSHSITFDEPRSEATGASVAAFRKGRSSSVTALTKTFFQSFMVGNMYRESSHVK